MGVLLGEGFSNNPKIIFAKWVKMGVLLGDD